MNTKPSSSSLLLPAVIALLPLANPAQAKEQAKIETMVVTASRHETLIVNAPASISSISREEMQLVNADDLADVLTDEVGVNITSVGQTRQGISIRGMPVEHTLYLLNGRRVSSSNGVIAHSDYELSWLPGSAVERTEVVRGPMSSLYGADALGGVINVITRHPGDRFVGELSSTATRIDGAEGGDSRKTSVYLSGPLVPRTLSFTVAGQNFKRENLADREVANVSEIEERRSDSAYGDLVWNPIEGHQLSLSYSFSNDKRERDVASRRSHYRSSDDIDRSQLNLSYRGEWERSQLHVNAYRAEVEVVNSRTNGVTPTRPRLLKDQVIDGHWGVELGQQHRLTLGGQLREETLEDTLVANSSEASALHQRLFIQDEWQLSDPLQIVAGVGFDKHEDFGNEINPRLYGIYQLADHWILKGGYGEGFRAPSLTELSPEYEVLAAGGRFWVEGNADLQPERSKSYELGIEYYNGPWSSSARVFENDLEGLVQAICYTNCGQRGRERRQYRNLDDALIRGVELSLQGQIHPQFHFSVNYTYLDTEDSDTGEELEDRPESMARLKLSWQPLQSVQIRWRSEVNGKQYVGRGNYTPSYDLHHVDIAVDVTSQLSFFAGIENLGDKRLADVSDLFSRVELGREFRLGFSAKL